MARTCVIIGGGLSGLSAAHWLTEHGWEVRLLEAQPQFGGRVFTHRFDEAPELNCELGGEWIGRNHPQMRLLCKKFGLGLDSHQFGFTFGVASGQPTRWYAPGQWPFSVPESRLKPLTRALRKHRSDRKWKQTLDRLDWWTVLEQQGFGLDDLLLRDLMDSTDFGESIRMTSGYAAATEYLDPDVDRTDEMDFKVRCGNDRLVDAMVVDLCSRRAVLCANAIVKLVRQSARRVSVTAHVNGRSESFDAEYCVCTVPARALREIEWHPLLPESQRHAAQELQYCRIVKTAVLYNRRFWPRHPRYGFSAFTGGISDFCFDSTFAQPGTRGILCSYAIGDKADDVAAELRDKDVSRWITEDMLKLVPAGKRRNVVVLGQKRMPWQRTSRLGGAYALYRPGQLDVQDILSRPHERVHFAGEHLADWQGFMEGAVQTGQSAAQAIVRRGTGA